MTEQEFIKTLENIGYNEKEISGLIDVTNKMKKYFPDMTYDELIEHAKKAHENSKNDTDKFITLD